jgi:hypothetical protein
LSDVVSKGKNVLVFDTITERHETRPLSIKDWLTLTQHTPGSTRLPPRFKMATRGSPVCLPATMALFYFAAPSSFPFREEKKKAREE